MIGFQWCSEIQHFSDSIVEAVSNSVEVFLLVGVQVDTLRKMLPDEAMGLGLTSAGMELYKMGLVLMDFWSVHP